MSFRPGSKSDFVLDFARYFLWLSEKNAIPKRNKQSNDRLTIHNLVCRIGQILLARTGNQTGPAEEEYTDNARYESILRSSKRRRISQPTKPNTFSQKHWTKPQLFRQRRNQQQKMLKTLKTISDEIGKPVSPPQSLYKARNKLHNRPRKRFFWIGKNTETSFQSHKGLRKKRS